MLAQPPKSPAKPSPTKAQLAQKAASSFEATSPKEQNTLVDLAKGIASEAGRQIAGGEQAAPQDPLHPVLAEHAVDNLKAKDEAYVKYTFPTLRERLRHVQEATVQKNLQTEKQQMMARQNAENQKNNLSRDEGKGKGSLKDRMFSAMGIKRGKKTASLADKSQTREVARTPSQ